MNQDNDINVSGELSQDQLVSLIFTSLVRIQSILTTLLIVQSKILAHLTGVATREEIAALAKIKDRK